MSYHPTAGCPDSCFAGSTWTQTASLKHLEHQSVFREDLGGQPPEAGVTRDCREMTQQRCADPLSLELVDHNESQFCPFSVSKNIAAAGNDGLPAAQ
jgi:hypothetical protein